jgi:hypothetical protein
MLSILLAPIPFDKVHCHKLFCGGTSGIILKLFRLIYALNVAHQTKTDTGCDLCAVTQI